MDEQMNEQVDGQRDIYVDIDLLITGNQLTHYGIGDCYSLNKAVLMSKVETQSKNSRQSIMEDDEQPGI